MRRKKTEKMKQDYKAEKKRHIRSQTAGRWLLFWTLFIGIGAVAGAVGMISDPSGKAMGMDAMLPYFQVRRWRNICFGTCSSRASLF